ncbi:MAG: biopolymer transporter ExbD [Bdellovibrionales bacterium]|nr:biopolymer transporter ExbD [Bdellovibrionales bacterium]
MLKRPSSRRRSTPTDVQINLVPMLDALVTLIGFLLFSMSFLSLVSIETPKPEVNPDLVDKKLQERPLQLTVSIREKESEVWCPFERIQSKIIPHTTEGLPDTKAIHEALIEVKRSFLDETKVVLVPTASTSYDVLVAVMDSLRGLEPTDPPLFKPNSQTGIEEPVKVLFPEIVFGNLLGEN